MPGTASEDVSFETPLDMEWVKLILMARDLGFSKEDIRAFLRQWRIRKAELVD